MPFYVIYASNWLMRKTFLFMRTNQLLKLATVAILSFFILASCDDHPKKTIVCWGDSLTAPPGSGIKGTVKKLIKGDNSYPSYLEGLLSDEYEIINCGVGGENTLTIAARQGSIPMFLAHDVILFPDRQEKFIGNEDIRGFLSTWDSTSVTPLLQCGWDENSPAHINPCIIQNIPLNIKSEDISRNLENDGNHFKWNYFIEGLKEAETYDTIKAGSIVYTEASKSLRSPYANIFFIGQNGGFKDAADLIAQLKKMITYGQTDKYIVISFHKPNRPIPTIKRMQEMEDSLHNEFGKHYINLRKYMVAKGIQAAGLKPTEIDNDSISHGQVPPQLLKDGVHFTSKGYELIAKLVQKKFTELGY